MGGVCHVSKKPAGPRRPCIPEGGRPWVQAAFGFRSRMCNSRRWSSSTKSGARVSRHCVRCVLGETMTSRTLWGCGRPRQFRSSTPNACVETLRGSVQIQHRHGCVADHSSVPLQSDPGARRHAKVGRPRSCATPSGTRHSVHAGPRLEGRHLPGQTDTGAGVFTARGGAGGHGRDGDQPARPSAVPDR